MDDAGGGGVVRTINRDDIEYRIELSLKRYYR